MGNETIHVLLVDDDEDDALIIRRHLERCPRTRFELTWTSDVEAARRALAVGGFDLYLVDYRLGETDGLTLLREIVATGDCTPVILLTGQGDDAIDLAAMKAGAADYLPKARLEAELLRRAARYAVERAGMLTQIVAGSRLASFGEMAGCIGHEINNPLGVISGHAAVLSRTLAKETLDRVAAQRSIDLIAKMTTRIANTVHGLHAFAKAGPAETRGAVPVAKVLWDTLGLCRERFKAHDVTLEEPAVDAALRVDCRAGELSQALMGILWSALEGVEQRDERWVRLSVHGRESGEVEIDVVDSRPDYPSALRAALMRPFMTVQEAARSVSVGLCVAKRIVEGYGGTLAIDETQPHATLKLRLPRVAPHC